MSTSTVRLALYRDKMTRLSTDHRRPQPAGHLALDGK